MGKFASTLRQKFAGAHFRFSRTAYMVSAAHRIMLLHAHERGRIDHNRPLVFQIYKKIAA